MPAAEASSFAEGPRRAARERALGLLYEAEAKHVSPSEVLSSLPFAPDPFAERLVRGVEREAERIDALVSDAAQGWELERMPAVDRALLRLAVYELLEEPAVPVAVVIDEAVELAKQYSTEESGGFVNGVLSTIAARTRG
ncbi:MAG: transcription antitermination factor NusB [Acidimicrobiales bacterium]